MIVTIKKDNSVKRVTKGAYENFYKGLGYKIDKKGKEEAPKKQEFKKVIDIEPQGEPVKEEKVENKK